jgi:hypothetical protein
MNMDAINEFADVVYKQRRFLELCFERDSYYEDIAPASWKRRDNYRRGWTSQDKNRYEHRVVVWLESKDCPAPSTAGLGWDKRRRLGTRVSTSLRLFRFETAVEAKRRLAILFCKSHSEYAEFEPPIIQRMSRIHLDLLSAIRHNDTNGELLISDEWNDAMRELTRIARSIHVVESPSNLPKIVGDDIIEFKGKLHSVTDEARRLFHALIASHPKPIFASHLDPPIRVHRVKGGLPKELKSIVKSAKGGGTRLNID